MRIVYLLEGIYPVSGGVPRVVKSLHDAMISRGHTVLVVCPKGSSGSDILTAPQFYLPPAQEGITRLSQHYLDQIIAFKPDIIHSHSDRLSIYYASQLAKTLHIPHVHTLHADYASLRPHYRTAELLSKVMSQHAKHLTHAQLDIKTGGNYDKKDRRDLETLARLALVADIAITPSKHFYDLLSDTVTNLRYLPSGHDFTIRDAKSLTRPHNTQRLSLVTVSRIVVEKRIDVLIQSIALARAQGVDVELTVVGSGDHMHRFKSLAKKLNVTNFVHFAGKISSREKLIQAYDQHDAFILGSYHYETQGLVLLEAAARGLPIIYCDERLAVGVTTDNSLLSNPSAESIAKNIEIFSKLTVARRHSMALCSLKIAAKWPFDKTADEYESIYTSLVT